jgi:hypothetical protein
LPFEIFLLPFDFIEIARGEAARILYLRGNDGNDRALISRL